MQRILVLMLGVVFSLVSGLAQNLSIYYIDMEGGAATLLVTPAGESIGTARIADRSRRVSAAPQTTTSNFFWPS